MKEGYRNALIDYAYITIGSAITALSIAMFTNPAQIAPGGVSGIGTLLYHTLGIDVGLSILVLSLPIFLIGVKLFGRMYGLKSLVGTLLLSLFTSMWNMIFGYGGILDYSKDMSLWLSCLYGGVLSGFGMGLVMKGGSNTGGTDIIALIIARYTKITTGTCLMIVDALIIAASAFIFSIESALYAIVVVFIMSWVLDKVVLSMGTGYAKTIYIISDHLEDIGRFILDDLERSGTVLPAKGLYTNEEREMLMTVIPNQSISRLVRRVHELDERAFLIIQDTHHVLGEGFTPIGRMVAEQKNDVTQE